LGVIPGEFDLNWGVDKNHHVDGILITKVLFKIAVLF